VKPTGVAFEHRERRSLLWDLGSRMESPLPLTVSNVPGEAGTLERITESWQGSTVLD
jgi:hypothetical protein